MEVKTILNYLSRQELNDLLINICQILQEMEGLKKMELIDSNLSYRTFNALRANKINTLEELTLITKAKASSMRNMGTKSISEISELLHNHGLNWAE